MVLDLQEKDGILGQGIFKPSPEDDESLKFAGKKEIPGDTFLVKTTGKTSPTTTGTVDNDWTDPANAFGAGGGHASTQDFNQDYSDFGITIPSDTIIKGIVVTIDGREQNVGNEGAVGVELSWDGGTTYTESGKVEIFRTNPGFETKVYGGQTDTWGREWTIGEFTDALFMLRGIKAPGDIGIGQTGVDHIQIEVYYSV